MFLKNKRNFNKKGEYIIMMVENFMCEKCKNMEMCSGFKTIKKFSEDYSKSPLIPDITVDDCRNFSSDETAKDA